MSFVQPTEENEIIEHAVQQLSRKYAGKFDESDIVPIVKESYQSFADTKVRTFVAVFTVDTPTIVFAQWQKTAV